MGFRKLSQSSYLLENSFRSSSFTEKMPEDAMAMEALAPGLLRGSEQLWLRDCPQVWGRYPSDRGRRA